MHKKETPPLCSKPSFVSSRALSFNAFSKKFDTMAQSVIPDNVHANLVCRQTPEKHWNLTLTNIHGKDVRYLLGRDFDITEEMPLEQIIPVHMRAMHSSRVNSLLSEALGSDYWGELFQKMMSRDITILNAHEQTPRLVSIFMRLASCSENTKLFEVTLTDKTAENIVANHAGLTTHNLRTSFRSILTSAHELDLEAIPEMSRDAFVTASPEQLGQLYDRIYHQKKQNQERVCDISTMAFEGLGCCASTRDDFSASSLKLKKNETLDLPQERLVIDASLIDFIERRHVAMSDIKLIYASTSLALLESDKINALMDFLWNLFLNARQAMQRENTLNPEISLHCSDHIEGVNTLFQCECIDNGPGMSVIQYQNFFSRSLPVQSNASKSNIESNRGEGTLMAYQQWKSMKGEAVVSGREDGKSGTRFQLSCLAYSSRLFKNDSLKPEQVARLDVLAKNSELTGIVLLVDDQLINLKILMRNIGQQILDTSFNMKVTQLSTVSHLEWQEQGLTADIIGSWGIISAANGHLAYEVFKRYLNIKLVLTDMEMPVMDGIDLIHHIRLLEQKNATKSCARIILNTGLDQLDLEKKIDLNKQDVECILKGAEPEKLKRCLHNVLVPDTFPAEVFQEVPGLVS